MTRFPLPRLERYSSNLFWFWIGLGALLPISTGSPILYVAFAPTVVLLLVLRWVTRGHRLWHTSVMDISITGLLAWAATLLIGSLVLGVILVRMQ